MSQAVTAVATAIYVAVGTTAAALGASSATAAALATAAVSAASAATQVAILAGLNAAIANQNKPRQQGGLITLTINPDEPRRLQIGKRLNAGVLVDWYVKGSKNNQLFMVIYLGEGPMGQVTRVFSGGRAVHTTPLVHGTRTNIPGFRSTEGGASGNRLWITYYDGRPGQTADSTLVAASVGWNSNHVGTGCAYAIVECLWDSDNLRTPPSLAFEMEGAKVYDRRLDTTAGGSGSHRANDPSTWALTDNPAVALDHYLLGRYVGSVKQFGVGLEAEDVPYARFAALANLCDEDVTLKATGTQKRYRANGFLFADRTYSDTIKDLCRAMNARPADFGGRIGIIDSEERTPVLTITDGDVIEDIAEQYSPKRSWGELVSVVRGTFQDPLQNYQAAEYPRVTDAAWVTEDGGSPKEATLDLEMETSAERAQRLAYLYAVRERRQAQLTGTYGLRMIELEQGDWFIRSGGIFGTSPGKVFEVIDRALDVASMTVTLTAFEVDATDSAWNETTAADPLPAPISSDDLLQAMEIPALTVTGITLTGTAAQLPAIRVQWTAPTDPRALQILVEAVPTAGGVPTSAIVDVGTGEVTFTSGITDNTNYLVRARFIGTFTPSAWTSNVAVTTLGDYAVGEATSVPWSGVTGAGRPADNADVTAANTAAGIAGQGWGATAAEAAASNARVPVGANALIDSEFQRGLYAWQAGWAGNSGVSRVGAINLYGAAARNYYGATLTGTPAAGTVFDAIATKGTYLAVDLPGTKVFAVPVKPGDRIYAGAAITAKHVSQVSVAVYWLKIDGSVISAPSIASALPANKTLAEIAEWDRIEGFATAPAEAAFVTVYVRAVCNGTADPECLVTSPMLARVPANQTEPPPYVPGRPDPLGDVTGTNTASAITGQGVFATGNYYEQASDPGSVANGSFWFKTDTNEFYVRRTGAWGKVSDITPATSPLSGVTLSSYYVLGFTSAGVGYSGAVTATAIDGDGTYTYFWTRTSQAGAQRVTCSNTAIAGPTFSVSAGGSSGDSWTCTITETSTSRSFQATVVFDISLI